MERAIVTVKRDEDEVYDLEVPVEVEVQKLISLIVQGLNWNANRRYQVWAEPPGRVLSFQETLAQAEIWDGATLILQTRGAFTTPADTTRAPSRDSAPPPPKPPSTGPLVGWRQILDSPPEPESSHDEEEEEASSGYVWKRLD